MSESEDEATNENKPLITQNLATPLTTKKLLFSTLTGTPHSPKHQHHGSSNSHDVDAFKTTSMPRSVSDNFCINREATQKYQVIKSTTVTEQLSNAPAIPIRLTPLRGGKIELKNTFSMPNSQSMDSVSSTSTSIDSTVKSGVTINTRQMNETYL